MRKKYHIVVFSCLCCISFYLGTQLIGETEASFSSQASIQKQTITTAFVFPSTIQYLEKQANKIVNHLENNYERINVTSKEVSLQETEEKLALLSKINEQVKAFYEIYAEMARYNEQVQEQKDHQHTFNYVTEGFKNVDKLMKEKGISGYGSQLKAIQASFKEQIDKLEKQKLEHLQEELEKQETPETRKESEIEESLDNDLQQEQNNQEIQNSREEGQVVERNEESDTPSK